MGRGRLHSQSWGVGKVLLAEAGVGWERYETRHLRDGKADMGFNPAKFILIVRKNGKSSHHRYGYGQSAGVDRE